VSYDVRVFYDDDEDARNGKEGCRAFAFQSFKVLSTARCRTLSRRWFCNQHALYNGDMATHHDAALTTTTI